MVANCKQLSNDLKNIAAETQVATDCRYVWIFSEKLEPELITI